MKLYLPELRLRLEESDDLLRERAAAVLQAPAEAIRRLDVRRKSLDARQRDVVWQVYGLELEVDPALVDSRAVAHFNKLPKRAQPAPQPPRPSKKLAAPVVVVGAGPAGLFCAKRLAESGVAVTVIERGKPIRGRAQDTKVFRKGGPLHPESNIQFGEGGAGAYSDGKLTYRTDDPLAAWVLEGFINYGAREEIRYLHRPHIGTEHLRASIVRMTADLRDKGVEFRYESRVESLLFRDAGSARTVTGIRLASGDELPASSVVLAVGHSARETFESLHAQGVPFVPKAFAVGVRAEHPQAMVDRSQYGRHAGNEGLPRASYALSQKVEAGLERGVYSFCMCPGGEVMACSSEEGGVVTNGMSYSVQRSGFANSGVVVSVEPQDFGGSPDDPFAGVRFQKALEESAFALGGGNYHAPAQRVSDFLKAKVSGTVSSDATTYRPGVREADLRSILPPFVVASLEQSLPTFQRRIPGYASEEGILVGVETRTSSPVRIPRGEDFQAAGWEGLYPMGEGAGYAGGIVSAAVDGVRAADAILALLA